MKVLMISLPASESMRQPIFPLGLGYLVAVLKAKHEVEALHFQSMLDTYQALPKAIEEFQPDLIGLSCNTFNRANVKQIINFIKASHKDLKIVVGGVHASYFPEQIIDKYNADYVVVGEGELTMLDLCNSLETGTDLSLVKGLAFKVNDNLVVTESREVIADLDQLPMPDYSYASYLMEKSGIGFVISSRGCPVNCTFCSTSSFWGQKVRMFSVQRVVDEMEHQIKTFGVERIFFHDDTFNLGEKRVKDICAEIKRRNLKVRWAVSCRVSCVSEDMIATMVDAGCSHICWGIESGSQKMLDKINKKISKEQIRKAYDICAKYSDKMSTGAFIMVGNPGESDLTMAETIDFLNTIKVTDPLDSSILYVLPGTQLYRDMLKDNPGLDDYWWQSDDTLYYTKEQTLDKLLGWKKQICNSGQVLDFDRSMHFWNNALFGDVPYIKHPKAFGAKAKDSELNYLIPPEIKNDEMYFTINKLAKDAPIKTVLEIGSSAGEGSTEAFVRGIRENKNKVKMFCVEVSRQRYEALNKRYEKDGFVKCYNVSSVPLNNFMTAKEVAKFYETYQTAINKHPLPTILAWLKQDLEYVYNEGVPANGIEIIKKENNIDNFDLVLIDGSGFTGEAELDAVYGARYIVLDDIDDIKNYVNFERLSNDFNYRLIHVNHELRNGYALFQRVELKTELPIQFFTIVLNGEPFIRHHIKELEKLSVDWHWHIVEGVAELVHDTAWGVENGARITDQLHNNGLSNDGTTDYINELKLKYPEQITVYRKEKGEFWDGKIEMINAPLGNLPKDCLLWQLDVDELWRASQISAMHSMFLNNPSKTAAYFYCYYFFGPRKYVSSMNARSTGEFNWLRVWRYNSNMSWQRHEPPVLVNHKGENVAGINPFKRHETMAYQISFQHFAYSMESQVYFKERYFGYAGAVEQWKKLQLTKGEADLVDYLAWVKKSTIVKDWDDRDGVLLMDLLTNTQFRSEDDEIDKSIFLDVMHDLFCAYRPKKIVELSTSSEDKNLAVFNSLAEKLKISEPKYQSFVYEADFKQSIRQMDNCVDLIVLPASQANFEEIIAGLNGSTCLVLVAKENLHKHDSYNFIVNDSRFQINYLSSNGYNFCVAKYNPSLELEKEKVKKILWVQSDNIGDAVLAMPMLEHIARAFKNSRIIVACQEKVAPLYEDLKHVTKCISFDKKRLLGDRVYSKSILTQIKNEKTDLALNPIYFRDKACDMISRASESARRIAMDGRLESMSDSDKRKARYAYTDLIYSCGSVRNQLERHKDFLSALGLRNLELLPSIYLSDLNKSFADKVFLEHELVPEKTVVVFAGAYSWGKVYQRFGDALKELALESDANVIAVGAANDYDVNQKNLEVLEQAGLKVHNFTGKFTLMQTAAVMSKCRLALGVDTGLGHIACAVGLPNVILMWGPHIGSFFPYSSLTTMVCLPLDCYACNGACIHDRVACVKDLEPETLAKALELNIKGQGLKSKICQQMELKDERDSGPFVETAQGFFDPLKCEFVELRKGKLNCTADRILTGEESKLINEIETLIEAQDYYLAEKRVRYALTKFNKSARFTILKARVMIARGRVNQVMPLCKKFIEANPNNKEFHVLLYNLQQELQVK